MSTLRRAFDSAKSSMMLSVSTEKSDSRLTAEDRMSTRTKAAAQRSSARLPGTKQKRLDKTLSFEQEDPKRQKNRPDIADNMLLVDENTGAPSWLSEYDPISHGPDLSHCLPSANVENSNTFSMGTMLESFHELFQSALTDPATTQVFQDVLKPLLSDQTKELKNEM